MNISDQQDSLAVCSRNAVSDVTFYDSTNIVTRIRERELNRFPFVFIEQNKNRKEAARLSLEKHLREGEANPGRLYHQDWIIIIVILAAFLYASIRTFSKNYLPALIRFFSFRSVGESVSADISSVFSWQSTLVNLISFFNISLFVYCTASYFEVVPAGGKDFSYWAASFGLVAAIITIRHLICFLAGKISGQEAVFNEYMVTIYQAYRYSAMVFFVLVILISYTRLASPGILVIVGIASFAGLYLMRIARLLLIFMKKNISILYLILYLCALEFLPVLIAVKYFTGLI
jgi:hypothetical protein